MAIIPDRETSPVRYLEDDESRELFDREARRLMGMSGEEFIRKYDAGEFDAELDGPLHIKLAELIMILPFGR